MSDWERTVGSVISPWAMALVQELYIKRCCGLSKESRRKEIRSTHDQPAHGMGPVQPFGRLGSVEAGLGGPLVVENVKET